MADRYWVGGTDTWNATVGTKWSLTSGGAGGQAVPTGSDIVYMDAASGTNVVTVSGARVCASLNLTGFTGSIAQVSSGALTIAGNITLGSGMGSLTLVTITITFASTITSNGKTISAGLTLTHASGTTVALADNMIITGNMLHTSGTFNAGTFNMTIGGSLTSSGTTIRVLNLGSGIWTFNTATSGLAFTMSGTNLTFTKGTATLNIALAGAVSFNLDSGARAFNGLTIKNTVGGGTFTITGAQTFTSVDLSNLAVPATIAFPSGAATTITSLIPSPKAAVRWTSTSPTTGAATVTCTTGVVNFGRGWVMNITGSGAATFIASGAANIGGNTAITFKAPRPRASMNIGM